MNKDHDVKVKNQFLEHVNALENETPGSGTGSPYEIQVNEIKFQRIEEGAPDERDSEAKLELQKLPHIQAIESESEDYLNIPLSGKWLPSVNSVHIGNNFRTMTNMRYAPEHPVTMMGMSRINTTSFNNYPVSMFHYTKAAVVDSSGTTIRSAESHLIIQGYGSGNFVLKQNTTAIPSQGDFSATQLYPAVGNKTYTGEGCFSTCPNDGMVFCYGQEDTIWDGDESRVSSFISSGSALANIADVPTTPQDATMIVNNSRKIDTDDYIAVTNILIGSTRPLSGVTLYATASWSESATVTFFNGTTWASITDTEGGSGTKKTITWTASSYTPVKKYIEGYFLYWYQIVLSGAKTIYHATVSAPFGKICDTWDGSFREIAAAYDFETYSDITADEVYDFVLNVLNIDDYLEDDKSSYWNLDIAGGGFHTHDALLLGFTYELCGLYFDFPDPTYVNTAATNMILECWTGSAWAAISNKIDGTNTSGKPFAKTGVISFVPPGAKKISLVGSLPLYYYRVRFDSDAISASTRIGYIAGIPKQETIEGHSFAIHAADRLMLGCNNYENKNELFISSQDRPEVFNGTDSQRIQFGDNQALKCGAPIFAQYASNIYNIILIFKATQTWILQWNQSNQGTSWSRYCISPNVGCPAPGTLCSASVAFENNVSQVKNVAIWRGHDGIYISNGQSPYCVSDDIKHVFDQNNLLNSSLKVNEAMTYKESAFVDEVKNEYHWLWASGANTTLDKEYVLDLKEWKWFEAVRNATGGSGGELQSGVTVTDTTGNKYAFGGISGYIERLEHGYTFDSTGTPYTDGDKIESTLRFGELIPYKNPAITSSIKRINLTCVPKVTDTSITATHYRDGDSTGTAYTIQMDETLDIDVSPATDWATGDVITGQTSGKTCTVVSKISATTYKVKDRNGSFTLGEVIGVTGEASKLADQGGAHPVFLISTNDFVTMNKDIGSQDASFHGLKLYHESTVSTKGFEPLMLTVSIQKGREKK